jgi:hypothetical protein
MEVLPMLARLREASDFGPFLVIRECVPARHRTDLK